MPILTRTGAQFVRWPRIHVFGLLPRVLVGAHLHKRFLAALAETLAPVDRLVAAQPVNDIPGECRRYFARATVREDRDADAKIGHQGHQRTPADPTAAVGNQPITPIALALKAETIVRFAELRESRHRVVDARRMQLADQLGRQQALTFELALGEMEPHP